MRLLTFEKYALKRLLTVSLPFLAFAAAIFFINPIGEFPLFDDWSFARTVLNYQETGKLKICGWASMTLVLQTWWGILWTKLFGFSFTVLRFSTIFCAFASVVMLYKILSHQHKDYKMVSFFCLILIFNPIFFLCSLSFMTDIPFLLLMIFSSAYFYSFLSTQKSGEYIAAILLCIGALLIRQLAVIVPVSFCAAWLFKKGFSIKNLPIALLPLLIILLSLKIYAAWYHSTQDQNNLYGLRESDLLLELKSNLPGLLFKTIVSSFTYIFYAGLFLLPAIAAFILKIKDNKPYLKCFIWISIFLSLTILTVNFFINSRYPFENVISILSSNGPGLYIIFDGESYLQSNSHIYKWILRFFIIIGAAGTSGLLIAFYHYIKQYFSDQYRRPEMIFIMVLLISNLILISTSNRFDRYLLTILPPLLFLIYKCLPHAHSETNRNITFKIIILIIPLIIYTTGGTSHYFAWNRARWQGLYWLLNERGVLPENIDGGFEFNGWYCFDSEYEAVKEKNWYWVKNNSHAIAFNQDERYTIEKPLPYFNMLKFRTDSLFVLKKN